MCIFRRQKELEAKLVEEETAKRIEEMVAKRVAEELERRKDEIEAEVLRRVEEAKAVMEKEMMEELQRQRLAQLEEERRREVATNCPSATIYFLSYIIENDHNPDDRSQTISVVEVSDDDFDDLALLSAYQDSSIIDYFSLLHNSHKL